MWYNMVLTTLRIHWLSILFLTLTHRVDEGVAIYPGYSHSGGQKCWQDVNHIAQRRSPGFSTVSDG